ncbi:MAG: toxin co-regulated pilus biosynthesis Q family protein [bacterium]|nr:toxin co-regulated pilus biosynthesis Q family protein [bacterium]
MKKIIICSMLSSALFASSVVAHAAVIDRQAIVDIPEQEVQKKFTNQAPGVVNPSPGLAVATTSSPPLPVWTTAIGDNNFRSLIGRWSTTANWMAIWDVDVDIPIVANDRVSGDFKTAVRHLLASTNSTDALKPCFYTNRVVRVVRQTIKCNPSE